MSNIIKNQTQKIFKFFGLQLTKNFKIIKLFKKNVFNTKYKKKVLISYLTKPFEEEFDYSHTNLVESYTAAKIFNELGYNVDVIDYNFKKKIEYNKYDVIYGMGHVLEESFYQIENKGLKRIFYATGCNPFYSNVVTTLKVREFFKKHNKMLLKSSRLLRESQAAQILLSDAVIVLGNNFVLDTYKKWDPYGKDRYFNLNAFFFDTYDIDLDKKNFKKAQKNFLWFGSGGLLHKGLDLLLDIFSQRNDIFLHICGDMSQEKGFYTYYKHIIENSNNIKYYGFVNIKSNLFKFLMDTCGFVVFPTLSEGGSPALLNTMANGGLIPITTNSAGLDIDNLGWILDRQDIKQFQNAINEALLLTEQGLKEKSKVIKKYIREQYSFSNYQKNLKAIISRVLN